MKKAVIYGLFCPVAGAVRYIGKSSQLSKRLYAHAYSASRRQTHKERWLAQLLAVGLHPTPVVLEEVDESQWQEAEQRWIAKAVADGWPLTNTAAGGNGASPLDEAARALRKAQMSRPEVRAKMSAAAKARWADPEKRAKALTAIQSEERRRRLTESAVKRATPEYRQMMSERSKLAWADSEKRANIIGGITDDTRAAVSQAARRMWVAADEEKRARMLGNLEFQPQ